MKHNAMTKIVALTMLLSVGFSEIVWANTGLTAGEIAEKLLFGGSLVATFMHAVSVVMGVTLMIMAGAFYKAHRDNPKFVPIERPIIYLFLGLILLALPYSYKIFGESSQALLQKSSSSHRPVYDPDAPLECDED